MNFIATITNVREVSLRCAAEWDHCHDVLKRVGLHAVRSNERAEIMISATSAKYRGIPVRELSFSIAASRMGSDARFDGYYLVHAYHSSRLFAFLERFFFRTPYYPAEIEVHVEPSASIVVERGGDTLFRAAHSANNRPMREADESWEGPIFLPGGDRRNSNTRDLFYARLAGPTWITLFDPATDTLDVTGFANESALASFRNAGLAGVEWHVRTAATHARSKTFTEPIGG